MQLKSLLAHLMRQTRRGVPQVCCRSVALEEPSILGWRSGVSCRWM